MVANKKALINPKNEDEECFKWAVTVALHHEEIGKDPQRTSKIKPYTERYNWQGLEYPMAVKKIDKFEKSNPEVAVNVLYIQQRASGEKGGINILRRSNYNASRSKQANLLLIGAGEKLHYTAIKSLSRLLDSATSKNTKAMHFCLNCLQAFNTVCCIDHEEVKVKMPVEKDKWLKYHDGQMQFRVPFAIYADFESLLVPSVKDDQMETQTKKLNKHVPCGWCTYSKFAYGEVPDPLEVYRGEDCVKRFVDHLEDEVKRLYNTFPQQPMTELTEVLKREHTDATECHICMKPFDDPQNNRKVRDHCHYTGLYRGAAHNNCNLKYKIPKHIPIVFHNLSGYDAHSVHPRAW